MKERIFMWTRMLGRLMKVVVGVAPMCALIFPSAVFSQEAISSRKGLEITLEKAVTCKADALHIFDGSEFDGGPDDARRQLEKLGVKIVNESRHGGEIRYRFPPGVKVFGYEASEALFFAESTTLFFINLRSGSDRLRAINETLRLTPVPKGNPDGYGYFNEFDVRYIRKLGGDKDVAPDTIFSGAGSGNGRDYIVIGCQNLAW